MLIEFSIGNFRSVDEKQTFSMVANADQRLINTNCFETGINAIPNLLSSAAIYGANASGKSTLIAAIEFMRNMVINSATNLTEGQKLNVDPFRFNAETLSKPTEFEINFIENNIRYQYGFSLTQTQIISEWLFVYIGRKSQRWFEREFDEKQKKYRFKFGTHFLGGKQRDIWKKSTRTNALFLSASINLNCEQLKPIFYWFSDKLLINGNHQKALASCIQPTVDFINKNKSLVLEFLRTADTGLTDIQTKTTKVMQMQHSIKLENSAMHVQAQAPKETEALTLIFLQGNTEFNFDEQSSGTQRLITYIGPFLDTLENGKTLIIDELETSLHSKLSRFLIKLFHNPETNPNKAQLIFSTHDTNLLDNDLFRRDQIWFMEKNKDYASELYPLTDFSPRSNEALEKGYLQGRYVALPFFNEFKFKQ